MKIVMVKNLAHLKRLLQKDATYRITAHSIHPKYVGLIRVVNIVQTNGIYSTIKDQPEHPFSESNYGKGVYTPFEKANRYVFGNTVKVLDENGNIMYEFEVLENV